MNQFLSNKIIAGIVAVALLVGVGVLVSSGDTSSTTRNAALVAAKPCTKPGQVTKVSKQSVVCATTNTGSLWYATMKAKGKARACTTPGEIREKSNIVWVCGVVKKKKLWQATQPLSALAAKGDLPSTTPDAPVNADNAVLADPAVIDTAATQTPVLAKPAALSLETQPLGGVNALALETQPVVQLLDQRGASISTAGITITAVSGRTDVVLSGNTAVTDATGRAIFKTLSLKGIMGEIALTFTAPRLGLEGVTSGNLVLAAGVATALVSDTQLGAVAAGQKLNRNYLHLEDSSRNVVVISGRDVVVSSSPPGLYGFTTEATASDGYVIFKELTLTQTGATTLTFTSGDLSTTSTVIVKPGNSQRLKITTEASEVATNDTAFPQSPVVQLLDDDDNNVTTAGITLTATITQFRDGATATTTTLVNASATTNKDGVATFAGLGIQGLIGTYTLGFTSAGGLTQESEKTVTLSAGKPTKLIVLTAAAGPVGNSTDGIWTLSQYPKIGLLDSSNNRVTKNGVTVKATVAGQGPTFEVDTDQGIATIPIIFSGDDALLRKTIYKVSNFNDFNELTADINLPLLIPVAPTWTLPAGIKTTTVSTEITKPTSNSTGVWSYKSSEENIATVAVTSTGTVKVTPTGDAGITRITATQAANSKYESLVLGADLVINLTTPLVKTQMIIPTGNTTEIKIFQKPISDSDEPWVYSGYPATFATVASDGTVTPTGIAGTIKITATQAATTKYESLVLEANVVIDLTPTVVKQNVAYAFDNPTSSSGPFNPQIRPTSNRDGGWTYASSDATIATVTTAGLVTQKFVGEVKIIATQAATTKYTSVTSTFNLVIAFMPTVVSVALTVPSGINTTSQAFTLAAPTSNSGGTWTFKGSPTTFATVTPAGKVTPTGVAGQTTITATQAATSNHAGVTSTADLVIGRTPTVVTLNIDTSHPHCKCSAPFILATSNSDAAWTYSSSNTTVATVATKTMSRPDLTTYQVATVTFKNVAGTTNITATQAETTKYTGVSMLPKTLTITDDYSVGVTGTGGGIVFYDAGSQQSWGRYLEAAPTDQGRRDWQGNWFSWVMWGCTYQLHTATAIAIGTGKANTDKIRAKCTLADIAADVANKYSTTNTAGAPGAAGQWFLPSRDELAQMYVNRAAIGGFAACGYWSSSEDTANVAWLQSFCNGYQHSVEGGNYYYVRPVRAF